MISDESTNVQRLSTVSVTAGAPLTKVAYDDSPAPSSRNGTRQSIPVAWGRDMQSSPFLPSTAPVLPGRLTRYNRKDCTQHSLTQAPLVGRKYGLASTRNFARKISERLKSNFFFLVPARLLTRPTILDPWPLPVRHSLPRNCQPSLTASVRGYYHQTHVYHCQPNHKTRLSINRFPWLGDCESSKSRDEHDALDALFDPFGPI